MGGVMGGKVGEISKASPGGKVGVAFVSANKAFRSLLGGAGGAFSLYLTQTAMCWSSI